MTEEELRALVRRSATIVKPGETLVVLAGDLTASQLWEYQQHLNDMDLAFKVLVVHGSGLAVADWTPDQIAELEAEASRERGQ